MNALELFDLTTAHKGDAKGRCPRRFTGEHEDRNPSCSVNFDKNIYYCPVCKVGGKISEMLKIVKNGEAVAAQEEEVPHAPAPSSEILNNEHREWLCDRGLSLDNPHIRYVSVRGGNDDYLGIWPVAGNLGQMRRMSGEGSRFKPVDLGGESKSKLFWASPVPEPGALIWLAEGPLDAVALSEAGASCVVSSMGAQLSDQQAFELRDYFVLVAYDNDAAGVIGAEQATKQLTRFGGTCVSVRLPAGASCKDPGDLLQRSRDVLVSFVSRTELEYNPDEQQYVEAWRGFSSFDPVPTGIAELDTVLGGGWLPGVHVVKGPPKSFKSTVMLACARAAARRGCGVLYLSTELSRREIWARLSSGIEGAPAWSVLERDPTALPASCYEEQAKLAACIKTFENVPLKRMLQIGDSLSPALVIVDYLQGLASVAGEDSSSLMARVKEASALLTAWARDTETAVLAVSSVSSEGSVTKYSGDVQYDAASVSSLKRVGHASGKSVRQWQFEMVRREIPDGVDSTVTLNMEELV